MLKTVLFDLDGTLLPMDQDRFVHAYMSGLASYMLPYGYQPRLLTAGFWAGITAMVKNTGDNTNEEVFWQACSGAYGQNVRQDEPVFATYYTTEFQKVKDVCGFDARSAELLGFLHAAGSGAVLATNPLFPAGATHSRIRWAGLEPEDFELVTTFENSSRCKPNPDYYREILGKLELKPEECLMVGNDADEDMIAETLGMPVFLLTDCLINRSGRDISRWPNGSFPELRTFIRGLL